MAGPITIAVLADVANARKGLGQVEGQLGGFGSKVAGFGKVVAAGLAAGGAAAVAFGVSAVKSASDAQQSLGATETVFGRYAQTVIDSSNKAAQAYGLSANEYRENANLLGALFRGQGVAVDQLAGKTEGMIGTAADLAATFGGTTKEAVEALGSAFKGEFDPLDKYGISLKQSDISALLAARGQDTLTGAALKTATQVATTDLIMKDAARTQGAFAKESDTLAGQQQRLSAQFENIKATIGTALLPVLTSLATSFNEQVLPAVSAAWEFLSTRLGPAFETARGIIQNLVGSLGGDGGGGLSGVLDAARGAFQALADAVGPLISTVVGIIRDNWTEIVATSKAVFTQVVDIVRNALELAKAIIERVTAIARGIWERWGADITRLVVTAFETIRGVIKGALDIIQGIIKTATSLLKGDWSAAWDGIKQVVSGAWQIIKSLVSGGLEQIWTLAKAGMRTFAGAIGDGIREVLEFFRDLPGRIVRGLGDLGSLLVGVGKDIVGGLISGIGSLANDVVDALLDLIPGPLKKFAGKLGIASPSRVFRGFGQNIVQGLVLGIDGGQRDVTRSLARLADTAAAGGTGLGLDVTARVDAALANGRRTANAPDPALELLAGIGRSLDRLPSRYRLAERASA